MERVEATDKDDKPILGPDKKPVFVYTPKKHEPLLSWYIKDARRREKHRIGVYFTEAEERKHPNDLNVSLACRLTNDSRTSQSKSARRLPIRLK